MLDAILMGKIQRDLVVYPWCLGEIIERHRTAETSEVEPNSREPPCLFETFHFKKLLVFLSATGAMVESDVWMVTRCSDGKVFDFRRKGG